MHRQMLMFGLARACFAPDDGGGFSLADLADLDVSDIAEVRFETLPAGIYDFEVTEAALAERTNGEGEKRFTVDWAFKVLECKSVIEPGIEKDSLVGKSHNERDFINPGAEQDKIAAAIGRVRARITDMGGESAGKLKEAVENMKGHRFTGKIIKQKDKDDKSVEYARLKLDPKKK